MKNLLEKNITEKCYQIRVIVYEEYIKSLIFAVHVGLKRRYIRYAYCLRQNRSANRSRKPQGYGKDNAGYEFDIMDEKLKYLITYKRHRYNPDNSSTEVTMGRACRKSELNKDQEKQKEAYVDHERGDWAT